MNWPNTHHLDHLAPLAHFLRIPLLINNIELQNLVDLYYPDVETRPFPSYPKLANTFDTLITTSKVLKEDMGGATKLLTNKSMRFIYCPHGNSDKGHTIGSIHSFTSLEDESLVYGEQMQDNLTKHGLRKGYKVGNYRLEYFRKFERHYKSITAPFNSCKTTLLYAPTWQDKEGLSSFALAEEIVVELHKEFNLIVKLHPWLLQQEYGKITQLESRYQVHFLKHFPPVHPFLSLCDAYIGDYSSIGYDFLAYDKPMFFIPSKKTVFEETQTLQAMGVRLPDAGLASFIYKNWDQSHLSEKKNQLYQYAFF